MNTLLESIKDPIVIVVILAFYGLGWLLSKGNELKTLKELFSKDRSEELKKAREELKDTPEEAAFYDEAVRQELFHTATRIHCNKKYRRMCQKLVTDGLASVEAIRQAYIFIYENNARAEVRFSWIEKIMAALLIPIVLFGILAIFVSLTEIASLFDVSVFPNTLFVLSAGILFIVFPLQQLLPMVFAWGIRKRLKEREQEDAVSSSASAEELSLSVWDTIVGLYGIIAISVSLGDVISRFDISRFPNSLFILCTGMMCFFLSLQQLLPMVIAWGIHKVQRWLYKLVQYRKVQQWLDKLAQLRIPSIQ